MPGNENPIARRRPAEQAGPRDRRPSEENAMWMHFASLLRDKPVYVLLLAICIIFGIGAGGTGIAQLVRKEDGNQWGPFICLTMFAVAMAFAYLIHKTDTTAGAGRSAAGTIISTSADPIRALIQAELEDMAELIKQPWIKRDLSFQLYFKGYTDALKSKVIANLSGSFDLENLSDSATRFEFLAQIDVSRAMEDSCKGKLKITTLDGNEFFEGPIVFENTREQRGLSRVFKKSFELPTGAILRFAWTTDDYLVDLPYAEFWATAHPLINLRIIINCQNTPELTTEADCYRAGNKGAFSVEKNGDVHSYQATGAFLPFQGLLVHVISRPTLKL